MINNFNKIITEEAMLWVKKNILIEKMTKTKPGSITYLLYGEKPSEQSINIKMGYFGEYLAKKLVSKSKFSLLKCGVQTITAKNKEKKDLDLIFEDNINKIIYYRELKANIDLDTEKLPATINKCKEIKEKYLIENYKDYEINCAILNWSVYDNTILDNTLKNKINKIKNKINVEHMSDFLQLVEIDWTAEDFYELFKKMGELITN